MEWHDLRKNPDDVPGGYYDVLVTAICGRNGMQESYVFISQWNGSMGWSDCDSEIIIGWTEIPKPLE